MKQIFLRLRSLVSDKFACHYNILDQINIVEIFWLTISTIYFPIFHNFFYAIFII